MPAGIYIRDRFNFIPTTSALDIGKGNVSLNDTDYKMAYVGETPPIAPKNSPFSNFSTDFEKSNPNASNKTHISFNSRNGEWLAKELNIAPITTNCSYMCASTQITGANLLCTTATYSAPNGGTFNNWTITQGASLVTLTGNSTPNVTLTALPDASGAVTLSLTMGDNWNKCGNITLTKTIWVGKPSVNLEYYYFDPQPVKSTLCAVSSDTNVTFAQQGITNVTFTGFANYNTTCIRTTNPWCVEANITNACGTATVTYDCGFRMANPNTNFYTIYPNPSNDIVNIDVRDANNIPEKGATISGELFDMMGQSKSKIEINNNKATFSVRGLNKGIYVLKIYINDKVESHQIAVE